MPEINLNLLATPNTTRDDQLEATMGEDQSAAADKENIPQSTMCPISTPFPDKESKNNRFSAGSSIHGANINATTETNMEETSSFVINIPPKT